MESLTVGQVAETFGVTVRTLHHYDRMGLISPSERSYAGYRLYAPADLERLAQVVVYRRLGFGLAEVAELLADVDAQGAEGALEHLRRQREAVMTRLDEMRDLVRAIDQAMERTMTDQPATTEDLKALFGDAYRDDYQAEAAERWGDTDAWQQAATRQASMTKADWAEVKAENEELERDLGAAVDAGEAPDGEAGRALALRHRASIGRHFDCTPAIHAKIAEGYVADERWRTYYDGIRPGLAQWLRDAIVAAAK